MGRTTPQEAFRETSKAIIQSGEDLKKRF